MFYNRYIDYSCCQEEEELEEEAGEDSTRKSEGIENWGRIRYFNVKKGLVKVNIVYYSWRIQYLVLVFLILY